MNIKKLLQNTKNCGEEKIKHTQNLVYFVKRLKPKSFYDCQNNRHKKKKSKGKNVYLQNLA